MSKKRKKKSAISLEALSRAHEMLYGKDWYEVGLYRKQAQEIMKKGKIKLDNEEISEKEKEILRKRLKEYEEGKKDIDKNLLFYKILRDLDEGKAIDMSDERVKKNLEILEEFEYVKEMKITAKGRKILE